MPKKKDQVELEKDTESEKDDKTRSSDTTSNSSGSKKNRIRSKCHEAITHIFSSGKIKKKLNDLATEISKPIKPISSPKKNKEMLFNLVYSISPEKKKKREEEEEEEEEDDDDEDYEDDDEEDDDEDYEDDEDDDEEEEEEEEEEDDDEEDPGLSNEEIKGFLEHHKKNYPANKTIQIFIDICNAKIDEKRKREEKKCKKIQEKNSIEFKKLLKYKISQDDVSYFKDILPEEQEKLMEELKHLNQLHYVKKPYKLSILESAIPSKYKAAALRKINMLRTIEPGTGEYQKNSNWVEGFMQIPFDNISKLDISMEDGMDKCSEFMNQSKNILDDCVFGLNDAKMQIMQMVGQFISNPDSVGNAIAIKGPMGPGKTTLVKDGISKIFNRPFAFIGLGGACDGSELEGHSFTYEGSKWGKIVQIMMDSKCMNPIIFFDELDKVSDTARGQEIIGILTHMTDTTQNNQFSDKFFSEITFDISKCLFIFSYNDETKINPILKDRMYCINTKGYSKKEKVIIAKNHLLPKIREQIKIKEEDVLFTDELLEHIVEIYCNKEEGVRNFKRCLETIYTKINLFRLMQVDTLFGEEVVKINFPVQLTKKYISKLLKEKSDDFSMNGLYV